MKLKAYAKINLSLRVFDKRPDGFHNIESVMQSVSLCDYITLTPITSGIELTCDDERVPLGKENLAYRAAKVFLEQESRRAGEQVRGVNIHIEKKISMAAGLAGGSADAAAVLYGLNRLSAIGYQLSAIDLINLAAQIGSDVPFCLTGGTCLVTGRGEIVEKQEPWPKTYFILVCPDIHVSTGWACDEFDNLNITAPEGIKNDLEPAVASRYEVITDIKEKLLKLGCSEAQMSGSGPTVFGVVRNKGDAEDIFKDIKDEYPKSFLVETIDDGVEVIEE